MASKHDSLLHAALRKRLTERKAKRLGIASAPGRAGKAGYIVRTK